MEIIFFYKFEKKTLKQNEAVMTNPIRSNYYSLFYNKNQHFAVGELWWE